MNSPIPFAILSKMFSSNLNDVHSHILQDMFDPEFYLEKYAIVGADCVRLQNGRYRDAFMLKTDESVDLENPDNSHGERRSIFIVTVPGTNDWCLEAERENCQIKPEASERPVGEPCSASKRALEEDDEEPMESVESERKCASKETESDGSTAKQTPLLSREYLLNSPIADRPGKACIVKVIYFRFGAQFAIPIR